nr:hypothetical protein [Tanacetum cinerariifolium]
MVNTCTDADLSAAVQNALQTLLPQILEEIREEFRTGSGSSNAGGNPHQLLFILGLNEAEAAEAIRLSGQITAVEAAEAIRITKLNSLRERNVSLEGQVAALKSAVVSGLEVTCSGPRDELMGYKLFKERVEEMQDEKIRVLSDPVAPGEGEAIGRAIDKGMQDGLIAGIKHGMAERSIADVAAFIPFAEGDYVAAINALRDVNFPLLTQLEANKDSSMADIMDLLHLEGPVAKAFEASQLQPSPEQLMILIHRLEDHVIIGDTPLAFSLEVAHNRVQRVRRDATARRLSLTDSILPLVEPLSARNIAVTTVLSTTFAQTDPVPSVLSTERSKLIPKASSFLIISTFAVLQVGMPISTEITASVPYEFDLARTFRKRSSYVNPPFLKLPWGRNGSQVLLRVPWHGAVNMAVIAFPHQLLGVHVHGGPIVPGS